MPKPATSAPDAATRPARSTKVYVLTLLAAVLVAVAASAAVTMTFFRSPATATEQEEAVPLPGPVVDLEPMTLNLADGRFLKLGLALQLVEQEGGEEEGESGISGAKARDAAIAVFGQRSYQELLAPGGRLAAQRALNAEVQRRYDGQVMRVYFTEFVMQ